MIPSFSLPPYCHGAAFPSSEHTALLPLAVASCSSPLSCCQRSFLGGTGVCCWIPERACSCWNHSGFFFFLVIHGERSDQLDTFLEQKPHGVSNRKPFADWGLWQAGEAGAGVWSERFDTPANSPLSLALVSKQYRSLSCSAAPPAVTQAPS